jgi:hypothetical protein
MMLEYMEKIVRDDAKFARVMMSLTAVCVLLMGTGIAVVLLNPR